MSILIHKSQECLLHRRKDLSRIPFELSAKVLGATEDARGTDEFDTGVNLGHVGGIRTEGVIRELGPNLYINVRSRLSSRSDWYPCSP